MSKPSSPETANKKHNQPPFQTHHRHLIHLHHLISCCLVLLKKKKMVKRLKVEVLTSAEDTSGDEDLDVVGNIRVTEVVVETLRVGLNAAEDLLHREVLHDALHLGVDRGTLDTQLTLFLADLLVEDEVLDLLQASLELSVTRVSLETLTERVESLVVHLQERENRSLATIGLDCL